MQIFFSSPVKKKQYLLLLVDSILVFLVFLAAYAYRIIVFEGGEPIEIVDRLTSPIVFVAIVIHLISFFVFELYALKSNRSDIKLFLIITLAVLGASLVLAILSYFFPAERLGRVLLTFHILLLIIVMFFWRKVFFSMFVVVSPANKILVIGPGSITSQLDALVREHPLFHYHIVGNFDQLKADITTEPDTTAGEEKGLLKLIRDNNIQTIVISALPKEDTDLGRQLLQARFEGIVIFELSKFYEHLSGKLPVFLINQSSLIFDDQGSVFNPKYFSNIKKVGDVLGAGLGLIALLPLGILIALLIKLTSRGPVFFFQERLGKNRIPFKLIKFRTMMVNAEQESGPRWASHDDPRITTLGKWLRFSRMDEIPQLVNILKGDMSFVGPRPIRKHFADQFILKFPFYDLRFVIEPGVTGWAQVNGDYAGSEAGQLEKLEYDLFYINNQSFFLDIFILFKTFQTLLFRHGV